MPSTRPHTIAVVITHNKALLILLATLLQSKTKQNTDTIKIKFN